jgi:pimeloyl-ACP methyl ester carboxylesterase
MRTAALALLLATACATTGSAGSGTLHEDVVFDRYTPLSRSVEIARRTLPPLTFWRIEQELLAQKKKLPDQAIDLKKEKFSIYVPAATPPPQGYGLLVWIPPWNEPTHPRIWRPPLDRFGLIFVAADNSGNEASILDRRLPLAVLAVENVRARFHIDPNRIYVGGLSGGSRAAQVAAMAYPDVFRGALLNAGSEPIDGAGGMYKPPAELFQLFQRTRVVYITGDGDETNLEQDEISQESMHEWCVFDVKIELALELTHVKLDAPSLDRALRALEEPRSVDSDELARCNARIQRELAGKLREAEAAIARGDRESARGLLKAIDARYAGMAAAALVELDAKLNGR